MEPNIWGPSAWTFLHTIALQYPELPTDDDKKQYYIFFNSLKDVLPCPNCRIHYSEHLDKFPIQLESRKELSEWLIDIHNEVNTMTGKRKHSYEEVKKQYDKLYSKKQTNDYKNSSFLIILVVIIIIGYYYMKNYGK